MKITIWMIFALTGQTYGYLADNWRERLMPGDDMIKEYICAEYMLQSEVSRYKISSNPDP